MRPNPILWEAAFAHNVTCPKHTYHTILPLSIAFVSVDQNFSAWPCRTCSQTSSPAQLPRPCEPKAQTIARHKNATRAGARTRRNEKACTSACKAKSVGQLQLSRKTYLVCCLAGSNRLANSDFGSWRVAHDDSVGRFSVIVRFAQLRGCTRKRPTSREQSLTNRFVERYGWFTTTSEAHGR